ncbi:hypothetical protein [Bartonella melophagi]|uniref:Uncharacterized protein n=1 Tax=Bartonella melophagi K-2C TaxID=1094557 RepID=J0QXY7_9HYPH|nr:hypothetical protein [Bartonella melophagi]EJF90941.1 hypothetical protein ME3_00571 [Bartonella melophagi K-2C]
MEEKLTPEEQALYDAQCASDYAVESVQAEKLEQDGEVIKAGGEDEADGLYEVSEQQAVEEVPQEQSGQGSGEKESEQAHYGQAHYGVVEQERQARQKAEQDAAQARELALEMAQKYAAMQQEITRRFEENVPSLENDPKAYMAWIGQKVQEQQRLFHEYSSIREQQERVNQEYYERQQLGDYFEAAKAQVQDKYPDLDHIMDYLYEYADNDLKENASIFPQLNDPAVRQEQLGTQLREICKRCQKTGENPVEFLVRKAKKSGYPGPQMRDDVSALQERTTAARTLAARGGQAPTGGVDQKTLSSMSETEFAAWYEKNPEKWKQVMSRA